MWPLLLPNHCSGQALKNLKDNLSTKTICLRIYPEPSQPPFKVNVWYYLLCDVSHSALRPNHNKTSACGSYTSKDSYLKTILPKSLPRWEQLLTAHSLFIDGVNTNFEWNVVEMSLPHTNFLSPASPSVPALSPHFLFWVRPLIYFRSTTITLLSLHLSLAMCKLSLKKLCDYTVIT